MLPARSYRLYLSLSSHSHKQNGMVPAVVFPNLAILIITFSCGKPHPAGCGIDDSQVSLVRNEPGNIITSKVISFKQFCTYIGHSFHGKFENGLPFLVNEMFFGSNCFI